METPLPAKPCPKIDPVSRGFWENCHRGILSVQRCEECGNTHYPGTPVCPACLSSRQSWAPVSGRGTLVSWVRFHQAYWDSFRADLPYLVCLVRLQEGPLMLSNFAGEAPDDPPIGSAVEVAFDKVDDELTLPKFRLTS
ncbi:OB-fold domain-containing protein [Roseomonas sp. E05]|uniref:Zn-ribbon domain-containing OB-fold protein n=1 Tax=Roseomonas sp. E05 TaxID=3046310 RepID=UPI0024B9F7F8|nr:OB-fold domain-containing protein [Roseomonas sp. E05]MDJ0390881.1 OB-fold domain-containing protein [Roseomonas sp. E05]